MSGFTCEGYAKRFQAGFDALGMLGGGLDSFGSDPERCARSCRSILARITETLDAPTGAFFLFDPETSHLIPAAEKGIPPGDRISLSENAVRDLQHLNGAVSGSAPSRALVRLNRSLSDATVDTWCPLVVSGCVLGLLAIGCGAEAKEQNAALLSILSRQLALHLYAQQLVDQNRHSTFELNRKVLELETVHEAGLTLPASLHVEDVTAEILELSVSLVDARAGFLFLKHPRTGRPELVHQIGLADRVDMMAQSGLRKHMRRVFSERASIHLDASSLPEGVAETAVLMAPVGDLGCIGVLDKESRSGTQSFGETDARLLELIGQQAGTAITNARLYRDIVEIKTQNENILSSIGNGVISTDLKGRVTHCNPSVIRIF
jgi:GAF domain-containing protein